ncbi:MAG: bifunctional hydroxymethylpyrimidine kinase/phosphomethylpyrimidine kinase [Bacteroidetes bacterium]|nr:bifunctional hydroxymethylpyrimidine kinase/phosphomethylpyrimidine kinase [Bacteroidota bacterium]
MIIISPSLDDKRIYPVRQLEPGAVHRAREVIRHASGKGVNAARTAAALGGTVRLIAPAGPEMRLLLEEQLSSTGITLELTETRRRTRSCITIVEDGGRTTEFVQEAFPMDADEVVAFSARALRACARGGVVLLTGSLPPGLSEDFYAEIASRAKRHGARVVIDAQRRPLIATLSAQPDVVKINREELLHSIEVLDGAIGGDFPTDHRGEGEADTHGKQTVDAALRLQDMGAGSIVVTDGAGAVLLLEDMQKRQVFDPPRVDVVNAVGSGDAMSGALALALERGDALADAVRFGIAAGAANAMTLLPGEVDQETIRGVRSKM